MIITIQFTKTLQCSWICQNSHFITCNFNYYSQNKHNRKTRNTHYIDKQCIIFFLQSVWTH